VKVLLDTDIGSDCDDAVCLAYLLLRDDCELVGVTTVGPRADLRADIAGELCAHFGQPDVPVVAGASRPMLPNYYWWRHHVNQSFIVQAPSPPADPPPIQAVQFMRDVIRAHPGQVVLLTVGPTSNAGLLATADPEAYAQLKAVYSMGGRFQPENQTPRGECNAMLDPAAFSAMLTTPPAAHLVAGVEVTGPTRLRREQVQTILAGPRLRIIRECIRACALGFNKDPQTAGTGMHDPFTAACIFHPEFYTTRRGRIDVVFQDHPFDPRHAFEPGQVTAYTRFTDHPDGPHTIVNAADIPAYHQHVDAVFARAR